MSVNTSVVELSAQIETMLEYQDAMNCRVNQEWREQNFSWCRAIWVECAELMDHYGWKWWKQQSPDMEQVKLELIDIWHFGLSRLMLDPVNTEHIAHALLTGLDKPREDFLLTIEHFVQHTLAHQSFDVERFGQAMKAINFTSDDLFKGYMGKNVLNFFRQDHGYKEGHYQKIWEGREDNEHLVDIVSVLSSRDGDFKDRLYSELKARYEKATA